MTNIRFRRISHVRCQSFPACSQTARVTMPAAAARGVAAGEHHGGITEEAKRPPGHLWPHPRPLRQGPGVAAPPRKPGPAEGRRKPHGLSARMSTPRVRDRGRSGRPRLGAQLPVSVGPACRVAYCHHRPLAKAVAEPTRFQGEGTRPPLAMSESHCEESGRSATCVSGAFAVTESLRPCRVPLSLRTVL